MENGGDDSCGHSAACDSAKLPEDDELDDTECVIKI